jgi:hypothetical protein
MMVLICRTPRFIILVEEVVPVVLLHHNLIIVWLQVV